MNRKVFLRASTTLPILALFYIWYLLLFCAKTGKYIFTLALAAAAAMLPSRPAHRPIPPPEEQAAYVQNRKVIPHTEQPTIREGVLERNLYVLGEGDIQEEYHLISLSGEDAATYQEETWPIFPKIVQPSLEEIPKEDYYRTWNLLSPRYTRDEWAAQEKVSSIHLLLPKKTNEELLSDASNTIARYVRCNFILESQQWPPGLILGYGIPHPFPPEFSDEAVVEVLLEELKPEQQDMFIKALSKMLESDHDIEGFRKIDIEKESGEIDATFPTSSQDMEEIAYVICMPSHLISPICIIQPEEIEIDEFENMDQFVGKKILLWDSEDQSQIVQEVIQPYQARIIINNQYTYECSTDPTEQVLERNEISNELFAFALGLLSAGIIEPIMEALVKAGFLTIIIKLKKKSKDKQIREFLDKVTKQLES